MDFGCFSERKTKRQNLKPKQKTGLLQFVRIADIVGLSKGIKNHFRDFSKMAIKNNPSATAIAKRLYEQECIDTIHPTQVDCITPC